MGPAVPGSWLLGYIFGYQIPLTVKLLKNNYTNAHTQQEMKEGMYTIFKSFLLQ